MDRKILLIGSMNLDPRSRLANTEIGMVIESAALGSQVGELFEEAARPEEAFRVELTERGNENSPLPWTGKEDGEQVRYGSEPLASGWRRFTSWLLGALAPEELL